jgi:uncharacterized protein YndB with AHSA1/START domain
MVATAAADDLFLRLSRTFDAPRERVFAAWTNPAHLRAWFGPPGVTNVACDLDVRRGGDWRLCGESERGRHAVSGKYIEVSPPERLSFTFAWHTDGDFAKPREHETTVTLIFKAIGQRTEMTIVHGRFRDATGLANHNRGWTGSFDKLTAFLGRSA